MKKIAFYGGSFDPIHCGHLTIAREITDLFELDEFWFIPAFRAPHKMDKKVTSPFCRYAMLALATNHEPKIKISTIELNAPEKPFTFETQTKLKTELPDAEIFFVIGADSWTEINTWREWEKVLILTNIIVVSRPGYPIGFNHIPEEIKNRIIDLRKEKGKRKKEKGKNIFITDAVYLDISATEIRRKIQENESGWRESVPSEVGSYIEKYELYI
ncbi:MAG TPA: nicotinate-nucleotide adenylyltransferase [Pyrinomonadaceae bacterium]|nr:nicotinate-nucleotide adenylyltransferase [Pyrinomonadaceae bacterium]